MTEKIHSYQAKYTSHGEYDNDADRERVRDLLREQIPEGEVIDGDSMAVHIIQEIPGPAGFPDAIVYGATCSTIAPQS